VKELFFLQEQKSHGRLPMAFRMIEGADRDQGIPKAMGGTAFLPSGFLPSLTPSLIKIRISGILQKRENVSFILHIPASLSIKFCSFCS
jgi:hypothetical protein